MSKNLIVAGGAAVALAGSLFWAFSSGYIHIGNNPTQSEQAANIVVPTVQTVEVPVSGILVSINRERRQSLLLMDLAIVAPEHYQELIVKQKAKIVNAVLKALGHKSEEYFYGNNFIDSVQAELQTELSNVLGIDIKEILVTKAVYQ